MDKALAIDSAVAKALKDETAAAAAAMSRYLVRRYDLIHRFSRSLNHPLVKFRLTRNDSWTA